MGEGCALEVHWAEPFPGIGGIQYVPTFEMYQAQGKLKSDKEMDQVNHPHRIKEYDSERYWEDIINFLFNGNLLDDRQAAVQLVN